MSWDDNLARRAVAITVIRRANAQPDRPLVLEASDDVQRLFGGPAGLYAVLQQIWRSWLQAKIEQCAVGGRSSFQAYAELAAEQPGLRSVLDTYQRSMN